MARQNASHVDSAEGVGRRLREARVAAGLRQSDLAFDGCSTGYISRLEKGDRIPSLQVIRRLADSLDIDERWLARGKTGESGNHDQALRDAELALRFDDLDEAERLYRSVSGHRRDTTRALAGLGQVAFRRDDPTEAIARLEEAFALEPGFDDHAAADTLGRCYALVGQEEDAIAVFRRFLARCEEVGDQVGRLRFAVLLANALIDATAFSEASELLGRVLSEELPADRLSLARLYWSQSRLHALRDETAAATRYARRALELLEATEHTLYQARAYQLMAHVELDAGNAETALQLIEEGRRRLGDSGTAHDEMKFNIEEIRALAALGEAERAGALALSLGNLGDAHPVDVGRCFYELARTFESRGDHDRALELYELASEKLETTPNRYAAELYRSHGALLEAMGNDREALAVYRKAANLRAHLEAGRTTR